MRYVGTLELFFSSQNSSFRRQVDAGGPTTWRYLSLVVTLADVATYIITWPNNEMGRRHFFLQTTHQVPTLVSAFKYVVATFSSKYKKKYFSDLDCIRHSYYY